MFITQLASPFGFLTKQVVNLQEEIAKTPHTDDERAQAKGDHAYYKQELNL